MVLSPTLFYIYIHLASVSFGQTNCQNNDNFPQQVQLYYNAIKWISRQILSKLVQLTEDTNSNSSTTLYIFIQYLMKNHFIILIFVIIQLYLAQSSRYSLSLKDWIFKIENTIQQYSANIPSSLAWDLIDNKIIKSDPYYRDNFLQFYKYQTKDATYRTTFAINQTLLASKYQQITFEGLDTHCEVYLNGELILSAHNMFRRFVVNVKLNTTNQLAINFTSSVKYDLQKQKQFKDIHGFALPANYSFTRKAAYQYGWDWGPRILSVGIWKEVNVALYNDSRISNIRFKHSAITKTTRAINCQVKVDIDQLNQNNAYSLQLLVKKTSNNMTIYTDTIAIKSTFSTSLDIPFNITNNLLEYVWWTWDLGKSNLVTISLKLININTLENIQQSITTGIRTVTVIQESNKTYNGTSFTVNLNGYDVYMRGGNYIPAEMSLARTNRKTYEKIRDDALFGRFNMLRVWGGGQFEKDDFYTVLDEAGILIWHDLMFACALYPSSDEILSNIENQMRDNIRRIRHHPSIGLWNGNNEIWIGWQQWGWKNNLNSTQIELVEKMYDDVFRKILPKVISEQNAEIFYWETSPSASSNAVKTIGSGDIHFWRVWGGAAPIEQYQDYVGRFNSEYGMQSMPQMSSLQQFTLPQDLEINSYILRLHERHIYGDKYLPDYTNNYSGKTSNLTRFSYFSQVMQSYALQMAITSLRLGKPFNMGSLYWQMNDCWPVSSWATVDYYGTYKAAHYRVRQVYDQLMVHTQHEKSTGDYVTYIVNDYNKTFNCHTVVSIITYAGEATKIKHTVEKTVKPFEKVLVHRFNKTEYQNYTHTGFIKMEMKTLDNYSSYNNFFFVTMKDRANANPKLSYTFQATKIKVVTKQLASYVWIYRRKNQNYLPLKLTDNYFTLTPGQQKTIYIGDVPTSEIYVTCYQIEINAEKKITENEYLQTQQTIIDIK